MLPAMTIPDYIVLIMEQIGRAGYEAWLVGGSVRDRMLGRVPDDYDIASSAPPDRVKNLFEKTVPTGEKYGTVTVFCGGGKAEVTTFRKESAYGDFRRPSRVAFVQGIGEDLARRDFTVNAMAYSPQNGLFDPYGGRRDLALRLIRAVGEPEERFREDALRILRAFRFSAQLGFSIEPRTLEAAARCAALVKNVSAERIRAELDRILLSERPSAIFGLLALGIPFGPEKLCPCAGRGGTLEKVPCVRSARWAALLRITGANAAYVLRGLKFDNQTRRDVRALLSLLEQGLPQNAAELKTRLSAFGPEAVGQSLSLFAALFGLDTGTQCGLLAAVLGRGEPYTVGMLDVNGADLKKAGIPPGPAYGRIFSFLLGRVIESPELNRKDTLLELARRYVRTG